MATGKEAQVADALFARAAALSVGSPALPIVYGEHPATYDPTTGKYLLVQTFPNRPRWEGMTSGRLDQGILQITVVWPKNLGDIKPLEAAAAVIAHFPLAYEMVSGVTRVKVSGQPWVAQPIREADKVSFPISIPWTA
jgi:hypothetical protein